jgi:hypothetical protein
MREGTGNSSKRQRRGWLMGRCLKMNNKNIVRLAIRDERVKTYQEEFNGQPDGRGHRQEEIKKRIVDGKRSEDNITKI